jgi:hypothetical protein
MKIRLLYLFQLLVTCCIVSSTHAQNQFNKWYFGQGAALDFNGGSPAVLSGSAIYTNEGSAAMADATTGDLLFYTDGVLVWDSTNTQMPNGFGLSGDVTTTQSALIVQQPGSDSLYYVFTVPAEGALTDLRYSVVDMSLNSGLGDVSVKNTFMAAGDSIAEKATAIRHCNGKDWWIIFHAIGNNHYLSWRLDSLGLSAFPVVSAAGTVITHDPNRSLGWLSSSNDATRLVLPSYSGGTVDIVDFDNATGMVANPEVLTGFTKAYGTAFSPDDQVLYVTDDMSLAQFDLTAGTAAQIMASRIDIVTEANMMRAIRLGPDGKLYVAREWEGHLGLVNFPNSLGMACTYNPLGVSLSPGSNSLGLPNTYSLVTANPCDTIIQAIASPQEASLALTRLRPQPCRSSLAVDIQLPAADQVQLTVVDVNGRILFSSTLSLNAGTNPIDLDLGHLAAGVYFLHVAGTDGHAMHRILKE